MTICSIYIVVETRNIADMANFLQITDIVITMRLNYILSYTFYKYTTKATNLIIRTIDDLEHYNIIGAEHFTSNIRDLFISMLDITDINGIISTIDKIRTELLMQDKIVKKYFLSNDVNNLPFDIREYIVSFI